MVRRGVVSNDGVPRYQISNVAGLRTAERRGSGKLEKVAHHHPIGTRSHLMTSTTCSSFLLRVVPIGFSVEYVGDSICGVDDLVELLSRRPAQCSRRGFVLRQRLQL